LQFQPGHHGGKKLRAHGREIVDSFLAVSFCSCLLFISAGAHAAQNSSEQPPKSVTLQLENWRARIIPEALAIHAMIAGRKKEVSVAQGAEARNSISGWKESEHSVEWTIPELAMRVEFAAVKNRLRVRFATAREQKFTWPVSGRDPAMSALIYPDGEGLDLPLDDAFWSERLKDGRCLDAYGGLSMPFWSYQLDGSTITFLAESDLETQLCMAAAGGRLSTRAVHDFRQRDGFPPYEIEIWPGGASPISPAIEYRQWLIEHGEYVPLSEKIAQNPQVAKLLGAIHAYVFGDGRTLEFLKELNALGVDRAWLGYDQDPRQHPYLVDRPYIVEAEKLGFLIGPYDEFQNIQDPQSADTITSVWGEELWKNGCIINPQGQRLAGFAGRGCALSSQALKLAEPRRHYMANRIEANIHTGINSYFLDDDAFGELYDDYSTRHPMTIRQDRLNRLERMKYISQTKKLVLGSEGGVGWSVPAIAFAHGTEAVFNDVLWALQKDKKVYGGWWPPERPAIFFKQVAAGPGFATAKYDPVYRLPLYQAVFHGSVISTDRWDVPLTKFPQWVQTRTLLELLYDVPSMWSLDLRELRENKEMLSSLYQFFSPIHRQAGGAVLSDFSWLTSDRKVQRTRFENDLELTANFGQTPYQSVPPLCIEAKWIKEQQIRLFCPKP
jgi:Glycosyl hydrolases related to GH101 family, GH129